MRNVAVVIPVRAGGNPYVTLRSLRDQTFKDFDVFISHDPELKGQAWALNQGIEMIAPHDYRFVLFSDDDIQWEPDALGVMRSCLLTYPAAAYCYGSYQIGNRVECDRKFDVARLRRINYISTMSLVRREYCISFDESLKRLIDWDYWLSLLEMGREGIYCGRRIFTTAERGDGITQRDTENTRMRKEIVARKHGLDFAALI